MTDHDATLRNRIEAWAAELDNRTRDRSARLAPDEVAAHLRDLAATAPDTLTLPGLTLSEDESLLNWRGVNYVRQEPDTSTEQPERCRCGHERGVHSENGRWCAGSGGPRIGRWGICECGGFTAQPDAASGRTADVEALADEVWNEEPNAAELDLMRRVLTSDWLAEHDAALVREAKAEGAREALLSAAEVAERHQKDGRCSGRHCHRADAVMLRSRAAAEGER